MRQFYLTFEIGGTLSHQLFGLNWSYIYKLMTLYGNQLIKEYLEKLTNEIGKGYGVSNLNDMRQVYLKFSIRRTLSGELSWNHYVLLSRLTENKEIDYYIYITKAENLSVHDLRKRIKSNEYERIGYKHELSKPKVNTLIKNPIIIKTSKIDNNYSYIDFLLFNYEFNCFVVVEIKITSMKPEYMGQVLKYINYVDKNIKKPFNDKTIGVVICKRDNKFVMEYCTDSRIFTTTYELEEKNLQKKLKKFREKKGNSVFIHYINI